MRLTERARRVRERDGEHLFEALERGAREADVARAHGLPRAAVRGIASFYDYLEAPSAAARECVGTACWEAGGGRGATHVARCLGRCYEAPTVEGSAGGAVPCRTLVEPPVVFRHLVGGAGGDRWADFSLPSGEAILDAVEASGLRGRGGAAFPTGRKWRAARTTPARDRVVVANGDEGDPGAYVDRVILEENPEALVAGMYACARAIGASRGVVFIRAEYPRAPERVRAAYDAARARGLVPGFTVEVIRGAGSYVAGEETALLRAVEGLRSEPAVKPPYPAERGLDGLPTVVQNIETLATVPWVVRHRSRADTKVICLSGAVAWRGAVEVRLGTPLREVLVRAGEGPRPGSTWKMALVGGPMGRVVPAAEFDTPLDFESLPGMGHGGVVVLDSRVSARALAEHLFEFAAAESCGNCTPCRVGTAELAHLEDRASADRLFRTLEMGSLCGFGQGVPKPLRDLLKHFPGEVFP